MICVCAEVAASSAAAWRSNAWRVIRPVLESYLSLNDAGRPLRQHFGNARLMQIEIRRARRLNRASTPMTRSEGCRKGQAKILYGAATSLATWKYD